VLLAER